MSGRLLLLRIAGFLVLSLTAADAAAQRTATITGVVVDSLNGGWLRGAEVLLSGSNHSAVTDSAGRFSITGVNPGTIQLGVFHPLLDSLGLSVATRPFVLGADSVGVVVLHVPSAESFARRLCKSDELRRGPGVAMGLVMDPDSEEPLGLARVEISWVDYVLKGAGGLDRSPKLRFANTDSLGRFSICGLPADLDARIQASRDGITTPEITFAMGSRPISLHALAIPGKASAVVAGRATISGRVVTADGKPVNGARVEIAGGGGQTTTSVAGAFSLSGLRSGSQLLLVRAIGYAAGTVPVLLTVREPKTVTVTMHRHITMMDPVLVTARRDRALAQVGFTGRRRSGAGRYMTRTDFERGNPASLSAILRMVPGLRVTEVDGQPVIQAGRGPNSLSDQGCVRFVVDGLEWPSYQPGDTDSFMPPGEIAALEIYSPSATPAEYASFGAGCTTILIWSRTRVNDR